MRGVLYTQIDPPCVHEEEGMPPDRSTGKHPGEINNKLIEMRHLRTRTAISPTGCSGRVGRFLKLVTHSHIYARSILPKWPAKTEGKVMKPESALHSRCLRHGGGSALKDYDEEARGVWEKCVLW